MTLCVILHTVCNFTHSVNIYICEFLLQNINLRCFVPRQFLSRIYALLSLKFPCLEICKCKKNDKYQVCPHFEWWIVQMWMFDWLRKEGWYSIITPKLCPRMGNSESCKICVIIIRNLRIGNSKSFVFVYLFICNCLGIWNSWDNEKFKWLIVQQKLIFD